MDDKVKSYMKVETTEAKTYSVNMTIDELKEIMYEELTNILDSYHIYHDVPSMDYSDNGDGMELWINGLDDKTEACDIINNLDESFEHTLKKHIKKTATSCMDAKGEEKDDSK
tara:strand:+ start:435 stop:773 length:339 start_codon:yes stop_codon:yes gene_type:complete